MPQNCNINSRFHSEAKLPLVMWHTLAHEASANHESMRFLRLLSPFGYLPEIYLLTSLTYAVVIV